MLEFSRIFVASSEGIRSGIGNVWGWGMMRRYTKAGWWCGSRRWDINDGWWLGIMGICGGGCCVCRMTGLHS